MTGLEIFLYILGGAVAGGLIMFIIIMLTLSSLCNDLIPESWKK